MRRLTILPLLLLTGCEKPSAKALREAGIVERTGDGEATCAAKRKVADAFLAEDNEADYQLYKGAADAACLSNDLKRQNGVPALDDSNNMTAVTG